MGKKEVEEWEQFLCRFPFIENPLGLPERTNEAAGAYAKACIAVAKECGIPVVDLWTRMQQVPDWQNACLRYSMLLFCMRIYLIYLRMEKTFIPNGSL